MPQSHPTLTNLRCEYRVNPLGIDAIRPCLSWKIRSQRNGTMQTGYRVLVSSSQQGLAADRGDLWDSEKVDSDQSIDIAYAGRALTSREQCCWKAKVWDDRGNESPWSDPARWSMGLLRESDWKTQWIGLDGEPSMIIRSAKVYAPCYLRKEFRIEKKIAGAVLYASALGWYEFRLNGQRVGGDYFTPGWTDYRNRIYYNTYDVTALLRKGGNAIGGVLSGGWYHWPDHGDKARLMGQLEVTFTDGSRLVLGTDESWRGSLGPESYAHILFGEACDSRKSIEGWDLPGFDASRWRKPDKGLDPGTPFQSKVHIPGKPVIQAYPCEPVRVVREIRPVAITMPNAGDVYLFDMGTNYAGFVRVKIRNPPRGLTIRLRFGEWLNRDGTLYNENLRTARQMRDEYICSGRPEEVWEPRFTFRGHRYVEVTGWHDACKPDLDSITGIELTQDLARGTTFFCGNELVNRLYAAIEQTRRANTIEAPTDCPQRNERQGWCGDALLFSNTATDLADMQSFYRKWLVGVLDAQHKAGGFARLAPNNHGYYGDDDDGMPGWADAGVLMPWLLYQVYGDRDILEEFYPAMRRYVDFRVSTLKGWLYDESKFYYGDWNAIDYYWDSKTSEWGADAAVAYAACTVRAFRAASRIAGLLGHEEDAARFAGFVSEIQAAFNKAYLNKNGMKHPTQGNCALACELVEGATGKKVVAQLVKEFRKRDWCIGAGIVSTPWILSALSDNGHAEEAYRVLLNDAFPSWGYMIQCASPAIWEHWGTQRPELSADAPLFVPCDLREREGPGFDRHISPAMNSGNHPALGSVGHWIFRNVGGIQAGAPGFRKIVIRPLISERIGHADVSYDSVYGPIRSAWKLQDNRLAMRVEIPPNTTAEIHVPAGKKAEIKSPRNAQVLRREKGYAVFAVGSGKHSFESR